MSFVCCVENAHKIAHQCKCTYVYSNKLVKATGNRYFITIFSHKVWMSVGYLWLKVRSNGVYVHKNLRACAIVTEKKSKFVWFLERVSNWSFQQNLFRIKLSILNKLENLPKIWYMFFHNCFPFTISCFPMHKCFPFTISFFVYYFLELLFWFFLLLSSPLLPVPDPYDSKSYCYVNVKLD